VPIVSPSSGFLTFAYAVAVLAVIAAFGLTAVDNGSSITGAASAEFSRCYIQGDLRCLGVDEENGYITLSVENLRDEPVTITAIKVGECQRIETDLAVPLGGAGAYTIQPCFDPATFPETIPLEFYVKGEWSGTTRIVSAYVQ